MKKFLFSALLLLGSVSFLIAAGQSDTPKNSGVVNLHIFHFKVGIPWNELTDAYAAENKDVVFTNEIRGGGAQWMTILKSKFAANAAPDIFVVEGPGQAAVFKDYLSDLSAEPWVARAVPFAREGLRLNNTIMGMPVNLEGYGYIYNKSIFRKAGVTEAPRTFSELRAAARAIKTAGYTPFATGYGEWWVLGLHLINIAFATQDKPQAFMDGLFKGTIKMAGNPRFEDLKRIIDLNVEFGEDNPLTTDNNKQTQLFASGQVAMIQQGNWKEIEIQKVDANMEIGVFPIPLTDDPKQSNRLPLGVPFYFVVNKASPERNQAAARKFLNWLVSSDTGKRYLTEQFGFIPAYGDIAPSGLGGISKDLLTAGAQDRVLPWMFGQFPDGMPQEFSNNIQAYIGGKQSWDEALTKMDAQWARLKK